MPDVDTLCIIYKWKLATPTRPAINKIYDISVSAGSNFAIATTDDLYTAGNFDLMIQNEYGGDIQAYFAAHENPTDERDGK